MDGILEDIEKKLAVLEVMTKVPAYDDYDKFISHLRSLQQKGHLKSTTLGG